MNAPWRSPAFVLGVGGLAGMLAGCTRPAPNATPEGAVAAFVEAMDLAPSDPRALKKAYGFLGPDARENLKERAERAGKMQGRRVDPWEMMTDGRSVALATPTSYVARLTGKEADVTVRFDDERPASADPSRATLARAPATIHAVREDDGWKIEPFLPAVPPLARRDGGL
jgi:hypothetical protein